MSNQHTCIDLWNQLNKRRFLDALADRRGCRTPAKEKQSNMHEIDLCLQDQEIPISETKPTMIPPSNLLLLTGPLNEAT